MPEAIIEFFQNLTWDTPIVQKTIQLVVLLLILYVVNKLILFSMKKYLALVARRQEVHNLKRRETITKLMRSALRYVSVPIFIIFALPIIGIDPSTVFASAGLLGIVVGFAFQDLLKDLVAGFFIIIEHTYEIGDMVTIGSYTGTVRTLGIKTTRLVGYGGEVYTINNRDVANVINVSQAQSAMVINRIGLSYKTDIVKLTQVIQEKIPQWKEQFSQIVEDPSWKGLVELGDSALIFELHTKVQPLTQFQFKREMNRELVTLCREHGFGIPFPTITIEQDKGS